METKIEVNVIKLAPKYIENEVAQQSIQFNKNMLRVLNEQALNRAYQLDISRG